MPVTKSPANVYRLIDPTEEQRQAVLQVLMETFSDYNYIRRMCEDDDETIRLYQRAKIDQIFAHGEVWVATVDGVIASVALWTVPGVKLNENPAHLSLNHNKFIARLSPEGREWLANTPLSEEARQDRLQRDEYFLQTIATLASFRQRGLARALIEAIEPRARSRGHRMVLSTQRADNVDKYKRLGFKVVYAGEVEYKDGEGKDPWVIMAKE